MPTNSEYTVTLNPFMKVIHTKIYLLNFNLQTVDELSGVVLDGATFSISATSDIRRTCNISIIPTDSSYDVNYGSKLWIDKYVQIKIGLEDITNNNEVVYTNMGIYLINNPSQVYNATNNTISIQGIDMMAKLTGLRNGYLEGITYQIPSGSNIRSAIISTLIDAGVTNYNVEIPSPTTTTPNAISIDVGGTTYDILTQLRDINANYQMYYDVNGVFNFNLIPSGQNEQVMIDTDIWDASLIEYSSSVSYENVKNVIEVYGKTLDDGTTPYGYAEDDNPDSPFYINGTAGKIRIVLSGGEYDNIYTDELAQERANYELYLRDKLQDQITVTCVPIYWLDVNWVVNIKLPNKQGIEEINQYIVKSVNTTLSTNGTQSVTLMRYYPLYP